MEEQVEPKKWNLLIVGGNDDVVKQITRHLNAHGVTVGAHWETPRDVQTTIPKKCNGVIILKDFTSHILAEQSRAIASKQGIPFCITVRKWASMSLALSVVGFLPHTAAQPTAPIGGRLSVAKKRVVQQFMRATKGKDIPDDDAAWMFEVATSNTLEVAGALLAEKFGEFRSPQSQVEGTTEVAPEVTPQVEENEDMGKPNLTVSVQTVPTPAPASRKPTREELIEALKLTALELMSEHNVTDIHVCEATGITLKVMEQVNVKL